MGVQGGEGADEAVQGVFGGVVEGLGEGGQLAGYGGDVEDCFWGARSGWGG